MKSFKNMHVFDHLLLAASVSFSIFSIIFIVR